MNKIFSFISLIFAVILGSCTSNNDKCIQRLFEQTGVKAALAGKATHLVLIPGNGCGSCIDKAKSEIHVSTDTVYIVVCHSEKDFFLLTHRHVEEFPNVYIDKKAVSVEMKMVETVPMVYALKGGKFISRKSYIEKRVGSDSIPQTKVAVNKISVDWRAFARKVEQKATFILTNVGEQTLSVTRVELSCDCMKADYVSRPILPNDTLHLNIVFRADDLIGEFGRDIYIYGNFFESPLELTVKGKSLNN